MREGQLKGLKTYKMKDESLFTSSEVLKMVNITYRQLSYWELKGIIKPTHQKLGTRDFKRYTQSDMVILKNVKNLLDEGYNLPTTDTLQEIARRKEAEEALRESREKYHSLIANIPDITWTADYKGNTTFISPSVEKIYGYSSKEICKTGDLLWFRRIHSEDLEKVKEAYKALSEKAEKFDIKYKIKRKDGEWIWLHNRSVASYKRDGVMYADGLFSDVTERKKAEEEIKNLAKFPSENSNPVLRITKDAKVLYSNDAGKLLLVKWNSKIGEVVPEKWRSIIADAFKSVKDRSEEEEVKGRIFSLTITPINNAGYANLYARDITERKKVQEKQTLRLEILKILCQQKSLKSMCENIVFQIKEHLNCEVVALRLKEGEDYPYFVNNGFPKKLIESENYLCVYNEKGNIIKDSKGCSVIACMCGIIINAKFHQDKPFFTKEGSFWTNSTSDLLASTREKHRGTTTRNVCNDYGYESVALTPIKSTGDNVGLLQVNDKRRDFFSLDDICFLEELGHLIGMVVERKKAEEELQYEVS